MSGSNTTSSTQNSQPWSAAQPYLQDIMSQAQQLYNRGSSYAPFNTVAPFSPYQQEAQTLTADRALNGSPVVGAADQSLTSILGQTPGNISNLSGTAGLQNTANGGMLNNNPYLDATYNQAAHQVSNSINSEFGMGGRGGSDANQQVLGQNLDNLATQIYGANYANERNLQQGAQMGLNSQGLQQQGQQLAGGALAPTLANQDYTDLQNLMNVGGMQQNQAQNNINDLLARYNYGQQQPWNLLNQYGGAVSGLGQLGGQSQGTVSQPSNWIGNLAGAGLGLIGGTGGFGSNGWLTNLMDFGGPQVMNSSMFG